MHSHFQIFRNILDSFPNFKTDKVILGMKEKCCDGLNVELPKGSYVYFRHATSIMLCHINNNFFYLKYSS